MTNSPVEATIIVKSDQSRQTFQEFPDQMSPNDCYGSLIAANERLRSNLSKVFTEYVEKARAEKRVDSHEKKRKLTGEQSFSFIQLNQKKVEQILCRLADDEEQQGHSSDEYQENDDEEEEEEEEVDD